MFQPTNEMAPDLVRRIEASLPKRVRDISGLIGLDAALAFVNEFGGTEVVFPANSIYSKARDVPLIIGAIGEDLAAKLLDFYRGDCIYIPMCSTTQRLIRDLEIIRLYEDLIKRVSARQAIKELAAQFFISNRTIEYVVNNPEAA